MTRPARIAAALILIAASTVAGFLLARHQQRETPAAAVSIPGQEQMLGRARPDFTLPDTAGVARSVAEWNGRVLILNFWATWCPPCRKEIPEFVALQDRLGGRGLQFVGIALQRPEEVLDFMRETGMNYPVLAGEMSVVRVAQSYGNAIGALPYTVVVDRGGHIAFVRAGPLRGEEAEKIITPLL